MGYEQTIDRGVDGNVAQLRAVSGATIDRAAVERVTKALIADRRKRGAYFPESLFADPAWDVLLILTLAEARCRRLSVSQLCERVDAPATTALRWITMLTSQGLLIRRDDVTDKRRKYIELSAEAYAKMVDYCSTMRTGFLLAA